MPSRRVLVLSVKTPASFIDGDRQEVKFDPKTGEAKLPESFKKSYKTFMDNEWWRIDAPVEYHRLPIERKAEA